MEVGIDLTKISRFENKKECFIKYILTDEERKEFDLVKDTKKPTYLATRWAAKEAIFKATQDKMYLSYTILNMENGKPYILNHPKMKLSISHEDDLVTAIVIVED